MVTMLREADKTSVAEVAKKHGISEQTIYNWRQNCGGMEAADVKRLKQLEKDARGLSGRHACALMSVARSALHYQSNLA